MKLYEIALLVILVAGVILVLAFGIKPGGVDKSAGAVVAEVESSPVVESEKREEPAVAALIDFSIEGEYELAGFTVKNSVGVLTVSDGSGVEQARFRLDENKQLVPAAKQPEGTEVRSAWVDPALPTSSKFNVYRSSDDGSASESPIFAIQFDSGNLSLTPGEEIERSNDRSYRKTAVGGGVPPPSGGGGGRRGRRGGGGGNN